MASNDDTSNDDKKLSLGNTADLPAETPAPVKKAAAKRAPRKATKKASAPQQATLEGAVVEAAAVEAPVQEPAAVEAAPESEPAKVSAPARKAAKRAPRKTAKKSAVAAVEHEAAQVDVAPQVDPEPVVEPEPAPEIPGFGLLFQAPEPTAAPRRRRATAPAAAPAPEPAQMDQAPSKDAPKQGTDATQDGTDAADDSDDSGADGARRRRRRGGKGRRGRSTGEGGSDESATDVDETSDEDTAEPATTTPQPADDGSEEDSGSRRRTRRRRRGAAGDTDDQPSTTTRVREPRAPRDEVTAVKGSTRLEAKKQRRREGRESGRRRTVITEAEFLARRESVERVMVVRHKQDRTQIGVLEDGVLVEHYVSREVNASMAGNVYLARVQNVLPSMEAAFADIGRGRNAVLYAGEVNWDAAGLDNNRARRIENALSSGQGVLVQVTKDPIGHKGARLTSQISLPGRYLVYVPDGNMMGISRKLPDTERARLKKILREVVPENAGVIVRTAAEGASEDELRADVARLTAAWEDIKAKSKSASAPALLHGEPDLTVRVIRDVFNEDFAKLIVSGDTAWETVNGYVNTVAPDLADRVQQWTDGQDLFTRYRVDEQIAKAMERKVWLPSGGSLVIDRTEAMTVIDVNTGKFVGSGGNLEETVTKNNIEAAEEIVRQLRLRDIGGIIVIDFIDMVLESNRDLVVRRLLECLGRDRTKHQVAEVTSLGLVQMTRKRVGGGLIEVFSETCEHCNGRGIIISADPIEEAVGNDGSGGGTSGGGNSGGGNSGGGDAGGGRGSRGRRARGGGRDTGIAAAPEPKPVPDGPTPAQIAAAAHAAAIHSASHEEPPVPSLGESDGQVEVQVAAQLGDQPLDVPVEVVQDAVPVTRTRRSSRSAKSPAVSMEPVVVLSTPPSAPPSAPPPFEAPVTKPDPAPTVEVTEVTTPVARVRRRRARVVAPAGPPPVVDNSAASGAVSGEFGS
jgi:ribonuclease E